jgi:hypothetical protein
LVGEGEEAVFWSLAVAEVDVWSSQEEEQVFW